MSESLRSILSKVAAACDRSGRDPGSVTIVGASKRQPLERLSVAYAEGLRCFGENRVQEAEEKQGLLPDDIDWHLIGPLQSNKARRAAELFSTVHSVDRLKIARALDRAAGEIGKCLRCLVQVDIGEEESKSGYSVEALRRPETFDSLLAFEHLEFIGLMAIPPPEEDPEAARRWFHGMRELRDELRSHHPALGAALSMGMSGDFEVAVEEGATHIRLGSILFGARR